MFSRALQSIDVARVISNAASFLSTQTLFQLTPASLSLSHDLLIIDAIFTCRRIMPSLGLGERLPAVALVNALQFAAARALSLRCIPSLRR
jgi:hypothetical protein